MRVRMMASKQLFVIPDDEDKLQLALKEININSDSIESLFKRVNNQHTYHIDVIYQDGGRDCFSTVYKPISLPYRNIDNHDGVFTALIRVDDVVYIMDGIVKEIIVSEIPF